MNKEIIDKIIEKHINANYHNIMKHTMSNAMYEFKTYLINNKGFSESDVDNYIYKILEQIKKE